MTYDPTRHHRRSIRLPGHDYARAGWYLVTICTQGRACLFGRIIDSQMRLNPAGRMVHAAWTELPYRSPHVQIDAYVVMPNHTHAIMLVSPRNP
jgi:REP element-mobilizing transposase RayT